MKFDAPPTAVEILNDEYGRDVDVIRAGVIKIR